MSRHPILFALALLALFVFPAQAVFAEAQTAVPEEPAEAAAVTAQQPATDPQPEADVVEAGDACLTPDGTDSSPWLQQDWMKPTAGCGCRDECRRDRDCNRVCGSFGGQCIQANSCCRECACYG